MTWNCTVTNKGTALQAKQIDGATITFTRVVSGAGIASLMKLKEQTFVIDEKQRLSMELLKMGDKKYTITAFLSNENLTESYKLSQVGFYTDDPDDGEILFAIAQIDTPKEIPTHADSPGYNIEFAFTFENDNETPVEITPTFIGYATRTEFLALRENTDEKLNAQDERLNAQDEIVMQVKVSQKKIDTKIDFFEIQNSTNYTLLNSKDGGLKLVELAGNSKQGENPAPGNTQILKSVGEYGKISQGGYDNTNTSFYNAKYIRSNECVLCKEGDVIKLYAEDSAQADLIYFNGDSFHSFVSDTNANEHEFTVPSGVDRFKFNIKGVNSITPDTVGKITLTLNNKYVLPIKTHGKNAIKPQYSTTTKNGVTITDNGDGTYTLNGECTENTNFDILKTVKNKLIPNVEYKVVGCPKGGNKDTYYLYDYYNYKFYDYGDGTTFVFDGKTTSYITIRVAKGAIAENLVFKPMITTDLNATYDDFEPYTEIVKNILLDEPIRKVGNVADVICNKNGVWGVDRKIKKAIFNGSESGWNFETNTYATMFKFLTDMPNNGGEIICENFTRMYLGDSSDRTGKFILNVRAFQFYIEADTFTNKATGLEYLASNPITVYYELATPTFTPFDATTQIELNSLVTFDGVTCIVVDSVVQPSGIDVEYGTSKVGAYTLKALLNTEILLMNMGNISTILDAVNGG